MEDYDLSDLVLYQISEDEVSEVRGTKQWHIAARKSQWHHKPMSVIVLGYDCTLDGSDTAMIVSHEFLHALIYLMNEARSGTSLDYYWYKYWPDSPPDKMRDLLEGMAYSGIGFL